MNFTNKLLIIVSLLLISREARLWYESIKEFEDSSNDIPESCQYIYC